jgi:hypothetical protein
MHLLHPPASLPGVCLARQGEWVVVVVWPIWRGGRGRASSCIHAYNAGCRAARVYVWAATPCFLVAVFRSRVWTALAGNVMISCNWIIFGINDGGDQPPDAGRRVPDGRRRGRDDSRTGLDGRHAALVPGRHTASAPSANAGGASGQQTTTTKQTCMRASRRGEKCHDPTDPVDLGGGAIMISKTPRSWC